MSAGMKIHLTGSACPDQEVEGRKNPEPDFEVNLNKV